MNENLKLLWTNRQRIPFFAWEYLIYFYKKHTIGSRLSLAFFGLFFTLSFFAHIFSLILVFFLNGVFIWFAISSHRMPYFNKPAIRMLSLYNNVFGKILSAKELTEQNLAHFACIDSEKKDKSYMLFFQDMNSGGIEKRK